MANNNPRVEVLPGADYHSYAGLDRLRSPMEPRDSVAFLPAELKKLMLRDPQVYSCVMIWKTAILVDGIQIEPSVPETHKKYKRAKEISDLCNASINSMEGSFHGKLLQLLDCAIWGYKAAVKLFEERKTGEYKGKLMLQKMRVVPNRDYRIRVDKFNQPKGLQSVRDNNNDNIISMERFAFAVFRPEDDNPLGTNILFPAYSPFYDKSKIKPQRMKNATQFGSPSIWAEAPENVDEVELLGPNNKPVKDREGNTIKVPINVGMLSAIQNFQGNGSGVVVPHGAALHLMQALGDGRLFSDFQNDCNMEIAKAILLTTLYTEQAAKGSTHASSKTGQGTVSLTVSDGKYMLADVVREQICGSITRLNYKEADWDYIPKVTLGNTHSDITSLYNAIAALYSVGFLDMSQRTEICRILGLPAPDPNAKPVQPLRPTGNVKPAGEPKEDEPKEDEEEEE